MIIKKRFLNVFFTLLIPKILHTAINFIWNIHFTVIYLKKKKQMPSINILKVRKQNKIK